MKAEALYYKTRAPILGNERIQLWSGKAQGKADAS